MCSFRGEQTFADETGNAAKTTGGETEEKVQFNRDIRPILSDRCYLCHGPDEAAREAELRLDSFADATDWAIVPGDAEDSEVIARITSDDPEMMMPTPRSHKARLTDEQVDLFKRWINQGAKYEKHWAYVPPFKSELSQSDDARWNGNPIDQFVAAKLKAKSLTASPVADGLTLLRRATLDLTGLPPTPEDVAAFTTDASPDAYANAVDRLLQSPAYGENMARYWLDAARYADSNGYQYDFQRDQWAWRDWVINAFNQNQPFDQFTIEQLAGDLLPNPTDQQRLATGFNRNHPITVEGGVIDEEYRTEYVIDRVVTTGTVWMGSTLLCCRCHDHKYDPITQKEFYQFFDFFNHVPERGFAGGKGQNEGFTPLEQIPSPFQAEAVEKSRAAFAAARHELTAAIAAWNPDRAAFEAGIAERQLNFWSTPEPVAMKTSGKSELELREDGSIFAIEEAPPNDVYEIEFEIQPDQIRSGQIGAIKLEALTDKALPLQGSGRSKNSNFVLSEFTLEFRPALATEDAYQSVSIGSAKADYSQRNYPISAVIDGSLDKQKGWAISGNERAHRIDHTAVFVLASPLKTDQPLRVRAKLHFLSGYAQHTMGRFRLSFAAEAEQVIESHVAEALTLDPKERNEDQQLAVDVFMANSIGSEQIRDQAKAFVSVEAELDALMSDVPTTMIMTEKETERKSYVLDRGEYDKKQEEVTAAIPAALPGIPDDAPKNRLGLARWLVDAKNPLTARVTVNRIWQQFFGVGLVDTPEDFGLQGSAPSHPELLDWLAVDFVESGWNVKRLVRMILMSETYRQSSAVNAESFANDPHNRLLARGPRVRMDAETIRDSALAISGLLNRQVGGRSAFPYHPKGLWLEVNNRPGYSSEYDQDHGDMLYRRSMYTFWKRTVPPPSMAVFDAPSREYCQVRRSRTNTPLQAFVMLHDPQFVEAARLLAQRMLLDGGAEIDSQIRFGFRACFAREPDDGELQVLRESFDEELKFYNEHPDETEKLLAIGETRNDASLNREKLAAMAGVARLLMNLSEFVTKG